MGYRRRLDEVFPERLANWYLYKKTFPLTLDQLAEIIKVTEHAVHLGSSWGQKKTKKRKEVEEILDFVKEINDPKKKKSVVQEAVGGPS